MKSVWLTEKNVNQYPKINKSCTKNIVVVGGGIAGYLTAFNLSQKGHEVTLIEAQNLFNGTTGFTTAHIDALHSLFYKDLQKMSTDKARLYYWSQKNAIDDYESLIKKYNIQCDFKRVDSFILAQQQDVQKLKKEYEALKAIGEHPDFFVSTDIFGENMCALKVPFMAIFDPIKFLRALPVNFEIFENSRITDVDFNNKILYCGKIAIKANKIIIATNYPIINVPGWYFLRMYKSTSYAVSVKSKTELTKIYQSTSESGITLRSNNDQLIVGGLDHRTGRVDDTTKYQTLLKKVQTIEQNASITHHWSANDCVTFDGIPFIGYYSKKSKDIYVITGFSKYGMANALTASKVISDLIEKKPNKYQKLFSPSRTTPLFVFLKNLLSVVSNLVIMPLILPFKSYKSLKKGEGRIVMYFGSKRAVYKDEKGKYHVCQALCAHLKCQLKFNMVDKTWDCPCHGSRFDIDGNLLVGPSVKSLKNYPN